MDVLEISNLYKSFGANKVIDGVSFSVKQGSVFGFLGQNGAGKTTTMKMVLGLMKPDDGDIAVCGEKVSYGQTRTNRFIGYLPDVPEFYGYMRPMEYLRLCGEISGLDKNKIKSKSHELLELVGLENANRKISGYSRGMKQRLGIAQALLGEPKLLICDEPTSALDPIGRIEILDILHKVKDKTTVVFSTHILSDVERICDSIAVLNKGKLAVTGALGELKAKHKCDSLYIEFAKKDDAAYFSALFDKSEKYIIDGNVITLTSNDILSAEARVIDLLSTHKLLPVRLELAEPTLENLFMEVTL